MMEPWRIRSVRILVSYGDMVAIKGNLRYNNSLFVPWENGRHTDEKRLPAKENKSGTDTIKIKGRINMANKGKYYMTTAIAYTSGKPHIGNTYEIILADAIARFKRQEGYDVYFQTGTDEHGQKIELKAEEEGVTPKE